MKLSEFKKKQLRVQEIVSDGKLLLMKFHQKKITSAKFTLEMKKLNTEQDELLAELVTVMADSSLIVDDNAPKS